MADQDEFQGPDDSFAVLTRTMEDGCFLDAAGAEVRTAIKKLRKLAADTNTRKSGTVTIKIKMTHDPKSVLETEATIETKLPKEKRSTSIHFTGEDGDILNQRPERQLSLSEVQGGKATKNKPAAAQPKAV